MNKALLEQAMSLPPEERQELGHALLDSVPPAPDGLPPLTRAQMDELDRRLAEHERDPSSAIPWEEVRARLWARLK